MAIERSFEVCSQGVAEIQQTVVNHAVVIKIGSATFACVTQAEAQTSNGVYLLEDGGRVIDTKTGSIMSNGNGTNDFEFPATA